MQKHSVQITKIHCSSTSESSTDEVYLMCQADAGLAIKYPFGINAKHDMDKGDNWEITPPLVLNFQYEALLTLWDHDMNDDPNLDTYLQSHDFQPGSGSGSIALSNRNGANYTIYYTYID